MDFSRETIFAKCDGLGYLKVVEMRTIGGFHSMEWAHVDSWLLIREARSRLETNRWARNAAYAAYAATIIAAISIAITIFMQ